MEITRRTLLASSAGLAIGEPGDSSNDLLFITGHVGNIGSKLIANLKRPYVGIDKKFGPGFDLADASAGWRDLFRTTGKGGSVIHLAAQTGYDHSDDEYRRNNIIATANLLHAVSEQVLPWRIVFASSTEASPGTYGNPDHPSKLPWHFYGMTKFWGEESGRAAVAAKRCEWSTIRIGYSPPVGTDIGSLPPYPRSLIVPDEKLIGTLLKAASSESSGYEQIDCIGS